MHRIWPLPFAVTALMLLVLGSAFQEKVQKITDLKPTVLLISMDGFRSDYMEKANTPNLHRLTATGVRAKSLIPSFPSKTFPNHYTIVTGLYPENHGMISNSMYDPDLNETFSMRNDKTIKDSRWWGGEPLWVTAVKQGQMSATYFWPGSEAEIGGQRPTYCEPYNGKVPDEARVDRVLSWLDLPVSQRPTFITLYFSVSDEVGHRFGPDSKEIERTIQHLDSITGRLISGLEIRGIFEALNIIVISDHGMATCSPDSVIFLDDYIDTNSVRPIIESPIAALRSTNGKDNAIYDALRNAHPHLKVYNKQTMPPRFHYTKNSRIAPILALADDGWSVSTHDYFNKHRNHYSGGEHGYDNALPSMQATFIAHGSAFKQGLVVEPFENIHIYDLMAYILGLKPAPNDGSLDIVRGMLNSK